MAPTPSKALLTEKAGPLAVWQWAAILLGLAYGYSRYKSEHAAGSTSGAQSATAAAAEPSSGSPYFVIENNEPPDPASTSVTVSPPGTGVNPPVNQAGAGPGSPILHGIPPHTIPIPRPAMGGTSVKPGEVIQPPVEVKAGETWASIARTFGISATHLQSANPSLGTAPLRAGQVIGVPYQVQPGQSVQSIAKTFGISPEHLEQYLPKNPT